MDGLKHDTVNDIAKAIQQMEGDLLCCICQDMYRFPVTFKCGHNFCKECAQDFFRQGSKAANRNEDANRATGCPECFQKASKRSMKENETMFHQVTAFRAIVHELDCL